MTIRTIPVIRPLRGASLHRATRPEMTKASGQKKITWRR
jgi:hypothetical protein